MGWFCLHKGVFEGVVPVQIAWAGQTAATCGKILALVSPVSEVQGNYEPSMIVNAVAHSLLLLGCHFQAVADTTSSINAEGGGGENARRPLLFRGSQMLEQPQQIATYPSYNVL